MFRQFFRLRDFHVAQNFSFKRLSSSRSNKIFALNFLHTRFTLPDDYLHERKLQETGLKSCKFPGKIHLVKDEVDEQQLVQEGIVCQDFERQKALGMDLEYDKYNRICLIQLASKENAVLWTCHQGTDFSDKLPSYLLSIIHGDVLKVGHGISDDDIVPLQKQYGECVNNIIDTLLWARQMKCNPLNLRAMCAIFLHQRLSKGDSYDWSKEDLTDKQLIYASTDAWASLRVYEEMKRTAEVLGIPLSPPLKSTMDVFKLRRKVKTANNRNSAIRKKRNRKSKKALTALTVKH